jgi:RNA polymerase sigma-70 factor (ECF subfamily)
MKGFTNHSFASTKTPSAARADEWDWEWIRPRCAAEAAKIVRRAHDAEEVVQEALMRAWRNRGSCRTPDSPLPWCLQITRNEAFRLLRRQRRDQWTESDRQGDVLGAPSDESDFLLTRLDVAQALTLLTPLERLLISLRYARDWSHPEIARLLQIPEATARVWLYRSRKQLRSALEGRS